MGTLTYRGAGCRDQLQLRADVAEFFLSLRCALGGKKFAYMWVPEWHKTDHGLHVHFGIGRYVQQSLIRDVWGRGFVDIRMHSGMAVGSTRRQEARKTAGYLSKYVVKSFSAESERRLAGLHRYEVAQGFQPEVIRLTGDTASEALDLAVEQMHGELPALSWHSSQAEDWQGPPAVWFAWD